MVFCALTTDQHKSLYKLIYKTVLENKTFQLQDFTKSLYDKVFGASNNHELALTYASFVPSYVSNLQTEDKEFRATLKAAKTDANELIDKIDEWENNIDNVQSYLGVAAPAVQEQAETPTEPAITPKALSQGQQRANNKSELKGIMSDLFNLPEVQAEAVATIYDMVSKSYAKRTGNSPSSFYNTLTFTGQNPTGNPLYQIVGGKTISKGKGEVNDRRINNLNLAKQLDKDGKSQLEIFHQTGWEKVNGEWKTELKYGTIPEFDKIKAKVQKNSLDHTYNITDIYKDSELEKYYTFVNNVKVTFVEDMQGMGEFNFSDPKKPFILINKEVLESEAKLKYVLVHELQHYVQFREGNLTNRPNYQSTDEYVYDPVEVEANNAAYRAAKGNLKYQSFTQAYQNATELEVLEDSLLYQKNTGVARAAAQIAEDGQAIIYALTNPNVSSPLHELAHVWEHYLTADERTTILEWTGQLDDNKKLDPNSDIDIVTGFDEKQQFWVKDKDNNKLHESPFDTMKEAESFLNDYNDKVGKEWTRATSEQFARGFEAYLQEGKAYDFKLQVLFDRFKEWLTDIYRAVFKFQTQGEVVKGTEVIYNDKLYSVRSKNKVVEVINNKPVPSALSEEETAAIIAEASKPIKNLNLTSKQYETRVKQARKLLEEGKSTKDIYDELGLWRNDEGQWVTLKSDVSGSEIDLQLSDEMRKIYNAMLGTTFNAKLVEDENEEQRLKDEINTKEAKLQEDLRTSKNFAAPIPVDTPTYYGHLSVIQQAFLGKTYDKLISDGKMTEAQLQTIINSTNRPDLNEAGLSPELVKQVMFRVNHPELMEDTEYWRTMPEKDSEEYATYRLAIREIAFNGNLANALQNDVITPEEAQAIISHTGQIAPAVDKLIKQKIEERGDVVEQIQEVQQKAKEEVAVEGKDKPVTITNKEALIKEVTNIAKDLFAKGHKGVYTTLLKDATDERDFNEVMKAVAEQASDPRTFDPTVQEFGLYIVDKALEMYPDANVGTLSIEDTEEVEEEPYIPDTTDENEISNGDTVEVLKTGEKLTVEEISHAETPEDNVYYLSDGSMKFLQQLRKVPEQEVYDQNLEIYNRTAPYDFPSKYDETEIDRKGNPRQIKGELTDEDSEDQMQLSYAGLKTLLERLKVKFGGALNYEILKSNEQFVARTKNGVVQINLAKYDRTTPFHEYLHPFIEILKIDNLPLYKSLAQELGTLDEGRAIIAEVKKLPAYKGLTAEEIGDEALVRYISKKAAENVNVDGRRKKSTFKQKMERLIEKFKDWFETLWDRQLGGMRVSDKKKKGQNTEKGFSSIPLTSTLEDIADMISIHDLKFDLTERMDFIKTLEKYQDETAEEAKSYEDKMIERIKAKIPVLENTARQRLNNDVLLTEVVKLRGILKEPDPVLSLSEYMREGMQSIEFASKDFNGIANRLRLAKEGEVTLTEDEIKQMGNDLGVIKNLIVFYEDAEDYFLHTAEDFDNNEYRQFSETLDKKQRLLNRMKGLSADIATEWLFPKINAINEKIKDKYPDRVLSKEKFRNTIYSADKDVDLLFSKLGSVSTSKDSYSAILRSALYEIVENNHEYDTETLEDIKINYDNFLKKTGVENGIKATADYYKNTYLRKAELTIQDGIDENKKPIFKQVQHWAFHQEFFYDLFDKERREFMEDTNVFGEEGFDSTNEDHIDKLFTWDRANGTSVQVGTKKQDKDVFDAAGKKTGVELVDVPVMKVMPGERFRNTQYNSIKDDAFFQTMVKHYDEANQKLGDNGLKYGVVPQVSKGKSMFADYKDKTLLQKAATFGDKTVQFFVAPKAEENTTDKDSKNLDGSIFKNIKSEYNQLLVEEDLDLTLPETVAKFASSANLTQLKREINPLVDISKSLIEGNDKLRIEARKVNKVTSDNKTIFDRWFKKPAAVEEQRARLNKQLTGFINDVMYGDSTEEAIVNVLGRAVDLNKLGSNWAFLTALNNMAGNITGGVGNFTIGNVQSFIESTGGRYFNKTNYAKGQGQYFSSTNDFVKDGFRLKKSKITQLGIKYDAIQGEFRDKYGKKFVGNIADRYANADTLFFINHIAEHQIQLSGFLAYMDATKVKTKDGQEISLFDAHTINKDGFLRIRDDVEWTKQDDFNFTNTWHGINKRLNGNYSAFDKAALQRKWYGKIALIYRKFIYNGFRSRLTGEYVDYELGNVDFGYQSKFFGKLASDVKEYKFEAAKRFFTREGWNQDEKQAYNKTMTELSFLVGSMLLMAALAKSESDDKDTGFAKATLMLYTAKLKNDIQFFTLFGVGDLINITKNPSAIMTTMTKYGDFFAQLAKPSEAYTRKTGPFQKGDLKLKAKFLKAFPGVRQAVNFLSPKEQLAYYNVLK